MTVEELIELLRLHPTNARVCIDDADTDWLLDIVSVRSKDLEVVALRGEYTDIFSEEWV